MRSQALVSECENEISNAVAKREEAEEEGLLCDDVVAVYWAG